MTDEHWWRRATIYQVYPRSFVDSDGDGIGDLPGIIDRLAHLVDLGVDTVWVSPFFASPQRDVGYDVSDYRAVAPEYGTIDDAQRLIDRAHELGLRVLFDLVLNHTSDQHPWFLESRSSRDNPKADWYVWHDGRRGLRGRRRPPNNWRSELQIPRAWQWCEEREQWYLATFLDFQPDLNWHNPDVRREMFDMIRSWLERGVDGFRLDIFGSIMHDIELRDNGRRPLLVAGIPRLQTPDRTLNTEENFVLATELREVTDEFDGERALLGEVFGSSEVLSRYLAYRGRPGLHLVFAFDFLAAPYRASTLRRLIAGYERDFPAPQLPTLVLENHDRARSLSRLGGDLDKAKVMATLLLTLRGVPVMYQGQEIGMTNRYIPLAEAIDPVPRAVARFLPEFLNRRLPERLNRDEVRTPMQWDARPGAGFTTADATPWLLVNDNHVDVNVAAQVGRADSLLEWYRLLLSLRREHAALHSGALELRPSSDDADVVDFERTDGHEHVRVVANMGDDREVVEVGSESLVLASSNEQTTRVDGTVYLAPHSAVVVRR
ncbi:MAG: alpha-amylase family glycosyl hydrolase [Acidimicrobiales bacterium]